MKAAALEALIAEDAPQSAAIVVGLVRGPAGGGLGEFVVLCGGVCCLVRGRRLVLTDGMCSWEFLPRRVAARLAAPAMVEWRRFVRGVSKCVGVVQRGVGRRRNIYGVRTGILLAVARKGRGALVRQVAGGLE